MSLSFQFPALFCKFGVALSLLVIRALMSALLFLPLVNTCIVKSFSMQHIGTREKLRVDALLTSGCRNYLAYY